MKYNPAIHHRRSIRIKGYDYSQEGAYFVTICTHDRESVFGKIENKIMRLSQIGEIVSEEWLRTPEIRPNVVLDEFVVMPNHFHGIIILINSRRGTSRRAPTMERFGKPTSDSIPTIMRLFKSAATTRINELRKTPGSPVWQRGFYEHIIRDEDDLNRIRRYIQDNVLKWAYDDENPNHLESNRSATE